MTLYDGPVAEPVRVIGASLVLLILVVAGCFGAPDAEEDPQDENEGGTWRWETRPAPAVERGEATCATDGTSRILLAGGIVEAPVELPIGSDATARVEIYDTEDQAWSDAPDLPVPIHHLAVSYAADRYWASGGYPGPTFAPSDLLVSWAPGETSWTVHERMPVARGAHGSAAVGDRIILVGGVTAEGVTARVDSYNTTTNEWQQLEFAPTAREHLGVDAIDDTVYVAGGRNGDFDSQLTAFDIYNATTDKWSQGPDLPTPRGGSAGAGSASGFFVAGGEATGKTFEEVERYSLRNEAWQALPPDPDPRHGLCLAALGDRVHVITGGHDPGFAVSDTHNVLVLD